MASINDIKVAIKELSKRDTAEVYSIPCTIEDIDRSSNTCTCYPINGDATLLDVKIIISSNGYLIYPKDKSEVYVTMINPYTGFISGVSDIDDIYIKVSKEIHLNGDNFKGLVKIEDLVTKLNNLENAFNQHLLAYNAHIHSGGTISGSTGITTPDTQHLNTTMVSDLENTTVKQGDGTL